MGRKSQENKKRKAEKLRTRIQKLSDQLASESNPQQGGSANSQQGSGVSDRRFPGSLPREGLRQRDQTPSVSVSDDPIVPGPLFSSLKTMEDTAWLLLAQGYQVFKAYLQNEIIQALPQTRPSTYKADKQAQCTRLIETFNFMVRALQEEYYFSTTVAVPSFVFSRNPEAEKSCWSLTAQIFGILKVLINKYGAKKASTLRLQVVLEPKAKGQQRYKSFIPRKRKYGAKVYTEGFRTYEVSKSQFPVEKVLKTAHEAGCVTHVHGDTVVIRSQSPPGLSP